MCPALQGAFEWSSDSPRQIEGADSSAESASALDARQATPTGYARQPQVTYGEANREGRLTWCSHLMRRGLFRPVGCTVFSKALPVVSRPHNRHRRALPRGFLQRIVPPFLTS